MADASLFKACYICKQSKPHAEFRSVRKRRDSKVRLMPYCLPCEAEYKKQHYQKNKDHVRRKSREWMNDELEIEAVEEDAEPEREYFVDKIDLPELRRYVCLDLARMCGPLPDKTVDLAKKMEAFLLGKGPRAVNE